MNFVPSKYQRAIFTAFQKSNSNINITAVAGSGKTTTLIELLKLVPPESKTIFLAFNRSIVSELSERIGDRSNITVSTIHSCGMRAIYAKYGRNVKIDPNKVSRITERTIRRHDDIEAREAGYLMYVVPKVIDLLRLNLTSVTPQGINALSEHYDISLPEERLPIVEEVYRATVKSRTAFDFVDMVFVPASDPTLRLYKYDYVFCDESQDFSPAQQRFIQRMLKPTTRLVTVGDPRQAIYGFAGADVRSYEKLRNLGGESITLPLSVSYRCSRRIIREAQEIVPQLQPAPGAAEGIVREGSLDKIKDGDWIVCRNLRPLVETYLWLVRNRMKAYIRGRDIAAGLMSFVRSLGARNLDALSKNMDKELERVRIRLMKRGIRRPELHPSMIALEERISVVTVVAETVRSVDELIKTIDGIFSDDTKKGVLLSTIHKVKGLETDCVYFLLPELLPSKYAVQPWQIEQEQNLRYVALTRARKELVYVSGENWSKSLSDKVYE